MRKYTEVLKCYRRGCCWAPEGSYEHIDNGNQEDTGHNVISVSVGF